jgi:HrpA-like RNA helicase
MQKDAYADIITSDPIDNLLSIIINETESKIIEEESKAIINDELKRREHQLFQRNSISNPRWMKLESKKVLNIGSMTFIEQPSSISLQYAVEKLHALGMIDDAYNTTLFGYLANLIRFVPIEAKRMIFGGFACGASIMDLITATAFIQTGKRSIFGKKYKTPNFFGKPNDDFIYRVLIGDELIGCMLLWNDFNDWINAKITKLFKTGSDTFKTNAGMISVDAVKQWCEEKNIVYDGWTIMIANRDVLIENLITIGINVHYNSSNLASGKFNLKQILMRNLDEGLEEVRKIKEAIYSGYYLNLCQWNENKRVYMLLARNIPIQTKSEVLPFLNPVLAKQTKPKFITVSNYMFAQSMMGATFEFSNSGYISVLDNYVNVDMRLNMA